MRHSPDLDFTESATVASARLFRTAYAVSGDRQLAEDAVQAGVGLPVLAACHGR